MQFNDDKVDSLIEIINDSESLIFEKSICENIKKYKLKIIDLIIVNDYVELIPKLKKIFVSDSNTNNIIIESLKHNLNEMSLESIKWLVDNENKIFIDLLSIINLQQFSNVISSDNFIKIYKLIESNSHIFKVFEIKIINFIDDKIINPYCGIDYPNIFKNYEKILLIIDLYIANKKKSIIDTKVIHFKIIKNLLKHNSELNIIINYKNYYKIKDNELKDYFEKNEIFQFFIKNSSVDIVNWFFEIASVLVVIKPTNYKTIFSHVCNGGNLELIKLVYNLIQCAGYKIDLNILQTIMNKLIYDERWGNGNSSKKQKQNESIIFELVNMGLKPPSGSQKYNEYYKNITIIKK